MQQTALSLGSAPFFRSSLPVLRHNSLIYIRFTNLQLMRGLSATYSQPPPLNLSHSQSRYTLFCLFLLDKEQDNDGNIQVPGALLETRRTAEKPRDILYPHKTESGISSSAFRIDYAMGPESKATPRLAHRHLHGATQAQANQQ